MRRPMMLSSVVFLSFVLGMMPATGASSYTFTTIDFPGTNHTEAWGINDSGQIVGFYGVLYNYHAFLFANGSFTTLDIPGAYDAEAFGINNAGDIVGAYRDARRGGGLRALTFHGFLFANGRVSTIEVPGSFGTRATGINDRGDIVGYYVDGHPPGVHGFLLSRGVFRTINPPGSPDRFEIHGINNRGSIVGSIGSWGESHAFLFDGGSFTTIDVPGADFTNGYGIGKPPGKTIVGSYLALYDGNYGFVLAEGRFSRIEVPGVVETVVSGINNSGQLVGSYFDGIGRHGFLATPRR